MPARFFALVPAAGTGARLGEALPKQYLDVAGQPLLAHAVRALLADARIELVFVVLAPGDTLFAAIDWGVDRARVAPLFCGGPSRRESVHRGLIAASDAIDLTDWVLVHDAARPCLASSDLARLIDTLADDPIGGLLASPVADTLKRAREDAKGSYVIATEPREALWQAQTPQMFRHGMLLAALDAIANGEAAGITDEASAVERLGHAPRLVAAQLPNLKVTYPSDLALAALVLKG